MTVSAPQKLANAFQASSELAANLQAVLVDLIALDLVGKQAHWNIVGPNFRDLHLNLDELVHVAREGSGRHRRSAHARHRRCSRWPPRRSRRADHAAGIPAGEISTHDAIERIVASINAAVDHSPGA